MHKSDISICHVMIRKGSSIMRMYDKYNVDVLPEDNQTCCYGYQRESGA